MSDNFRKRLLTSLFLILLFIIIFISKPVLIFTLIIIGVFSILEFIQLIKKVIKNKLYNFVFDILFIIYIFLFCLIFFLFSDAVISRLILFSLLSCCIASDIGGYIFGKLFKGPKLTKISPNKTISGSIGSIILSCLVCQGIYFIFTSKVSLNVIIIAMSVSIACQIGDIFFILKRKAKIKDTGKFLPGHGYFRSN